MNKADRFGGLKPFEFHHLPPGVSVQDVYAYNQAQDVQPNIQDEFYYRQKNEKVEGYKDPDVWDPPTPKPYQKKNTVPVKKPI